MKLKSMVFSLSGDAIGSIGAQASVAVGGGQVHMVVDVNGYWE
jgi:hypothetical protein